MKKISLILVIAICYFAIEIGATTISPYILFKKPDDDSKQIDYELALDAFNKEMFKVELLTKRTNGEEYDICNLELFKRIPISKPPLQINTLLTGKKIYDEIAEIDAYQLDTRLEYKNWNAGLGIFWDMSPHLKFIFGKYYYYEFKTDLKVLDFLIDELMHNYLEIRINTLTSNFKEWQHESFMKLSTKITTRLNVYANAKEVYYGKFNWQFMFGLEIRLNNGDE